MVSKLDELLKKFSFDRDSVTEMFSVNPNIASVLTRVVGVEVQACPASEVFYETVEAVDLRDQEAGEMSLFGKMLIVKDKKLLKCKYTRKDATEWFDENGRKMFESSIRNDIPGGKRELVFRNYLKEAYKVFCYLDLEPWQNYVDSIIDEANAKVEKIEKAFKEKIEKLEKAVFKENGEVGLLRREDVFNADGKAKFQPAGSYQPAGEYVTQSIFNETKTSFTNMFTNYSDTKAMNAAIGVVEKKFEKYTDSNGMNKAITESMDAKLVSYKVWSDAVKYLDDTFIPILNEIGIYLPKYIDSSVYTAYPNVKDVNELEADVRFFILAEGGNKEFSNGHLSVKKGTVTFNCLFSSNTAIKVAAEYNKPRECIYFTTNLPNHEIKAMSFNICKFVKK